MVMLVSKFLKCRMRWNIGTNVSLQWTDGTRIDWTLSSNIRKTSVNRQHHPTRFMARPYRRTMNLSLTQAPQACFNNQPEDISNVLLTGCSVLSFFKAISYLLFIWLLLCFTEDLFHYAGVSSICTAVVRDPLCEGVPWGSEPGKLGLWSHFTSFVSKLSPCRGKPGGSKLERYSHKLEYSHQFYGWNRPHSKQSQPPRVDSPMTSLFHSGLLEFIRYHQRWIFRMIPYFKIMASLHRIFRKFKWFLREFFTNNPKRYLNVQTSISGSGQVASKFSTVDWLSQWNWRWHWPDSCKNWSMSTQVWVPLTSSGNARTGKSNDHNIEFK